MASVSPYLQAGRTADGLVLRTHWTPGRNEPEVEVVHAEPRALFSGELLRRVRHGEALPFTECDRVEIGGLVRINARDRRLVYRLVEHNEAFDIYTGQWPD